MDSLGHGEHFHVRQTGHDLHTILSTRVEVVREDAQLPPKNPEITARPSEFPGKNNAEPI